MPPRDATLLCMITAILADAHPFDWRYVLTNYLPVIINATYVALTVVIVKYTSRAAKASETSAKAAEESAKAAMESAELTKESLTIVQRAYVALKSIDVDWIANPNQTPAFRIVLRNAGSTPAIAGVFSAECRLIDPQSASGPSVPPYSRSPQICIAIAPHDEFKHTIVQPLNDGELFAIRGNRKVILIWGVLAYEDIFGAKHTSRFCAVYSNADGVKLTPFHYEIS